MESIETSEADARPYVAPALPACLACGGSGWLGGPSYYNPGEGGEPCPACVQAVDASTPVEIPPAKTEGSGEPIPQEEWNTAFGHVSAYLRARKIGADLGQVAAMCDVVAFALKAAPAAPQWRCFHCGDSFSDRAAAAEHFGKSEVREPACFINIAKYREMEARQERYFEEDTDLHREIARLQSEQGTALRREEEKGYARGLDDGRKLPAPAAQAAPQAGEDARPFMYAIKGPDGEAHFDEWCVSGAKGDLADVVYSLYDEQEGGPFQEVALYLEAPQPADQAAPAARLVAGALREPIQGDGWRVVWWNESMRLLLPDGMKLDRCYTYQNGTMQLTIKAALTTQGASHG